VLYYLETVLDDAGFNVLTASNGEEALEKVKEKKPDFISLDLVMPKKSGIKFYYELRRNKEWVKIPVVIVTGHARDELGKKDLAELFEGKTISGPKVYLEKPVKPEDFINMIKKELGIPIQESITEFDEKEARKELNELLKEADPQTLRKALNLLKKKK